jgi:hypothetical protein
MAIRKLEKVYCSLNLGYVYSVNYSFAPQTGVRISVFFVNDKGVYNTGFLKTNNPQRAQIKIGSAAFNMYPVNWEKTQSGTQKTIRVDFIDDTIKLKNYYIALTGKGCGTGVFQLGRVVDNRTDGEKEREDPDLFRIKAFTQDLDLEYSFSEFVSVLKRVFPVKINPSIDNTVTRPFTGTLDEVLGAWCAYFNYSYFFENGSLVIFDPTSLNITFPSIPADAIESSEYESIENTYDKTVWNNFYQDGGEVNIGATDEDDAENNLFIANETLFPWEDISDIKTLNNNIYGPIDESQVVAAQYGKEFWFLYNYSKGTEGSICGFDKYSSSPAIFSSVSDQLAQQSQNVKEALGVGKDIATFDEELFEENFAFYYNYGRSIAGRYYVSNQTLGFGTFDLYTWYNQNETKSTTIENLKQQAIIQADYFVKPVDSSYGFIGDSISDRFKGLALNGQRIYMKDNVDRDFDAYFSLTSEQKQEVAGYYNRIMGGDFGSNGILWTDGTYRNYKIYENLTLSSVLTNLFNEVIPQKIRDENSVLKYRYSNFQMKGYFSAEVDDQNVNSLVDETDVQQTNKGPRISSNTSVVKFKKNSDYVAYYKKYNSCDSKSTDSRLLNRRFESITPSIDIPIPINIFKNSKGVIDINRDLTFVQKYKDSNILEKFAKPFAITEKRLSFSLNYFYDAIPISFISNGLVGLSLSVGENGLTASYSYSNEMLRVPLSTQLVEKLERSIKSSWIRTYHPPRQTV